MKKVILGAVAVAVLAVAGGGYMILQKGAESKALAAIDEFRKLLSPGDTLTHGVIEASAFSAGVTIHDIDLREGDSGSIKAETLMIEGGEKRDDGSLVADALRLTNVTTEGPRALTATVVGIELEGAEIPDLATITLSTPADLLTTVQMDRFVMDGLSMGDEKGTGSADRIVIDDLSDGRIDLLTIRGLALDMKGQQPGQVSLATFEVGPIDVVAFDSEVPFSGFELIDRFDVSGLTADIDGSGRFGVAEISLDDIERTGAIVTAVDAKISGAELAVSAIDDVNARDTFTKLGYETISFDAAVSQHFDPEARTFEISSFSIAMRDGGTVKAAFSLGDVVLPSSPEPFGASQLNPLMTASLHSLELGYQDASLVRRLIKLAAETQGMDEKTMTDLWRSQMEGVFQGGTGPFGQDLAKALTAFFENPSELVLSANPKTPVPLNDIVGGAMFAPTGVPDQIGLTIEYR